MKTLYQINVELMKIELKYHYKYILKIFEDSYDCKSQVFNRIYKNM